MKKTYEKPLVEIESYVLSASIAAQCDSTVSMGPEALGYTVCDEFKDSFEVATYGKSKSTGEVPFYDNAVCSCYYSSTGGNYMTS